MGARHWLVADVLGPALISARGGLRGQPPAPQIQDPTRASKRLQDRIDESRTPEAIQQKVPNITLRGRVIGRGKPATAIVEVDGHLVTVAAGTSIMLGASQTLTFV